MLFDLPPDLCFLPSTLIKSYEQREGAIAVGTKRAAPGLGTDFRGHILPAYIQLANTANRENKFCHETSRRGTRYGTHGLKLKFSIIAKRGIKVL